MAEVTAALVKELREITGAGMMDCKKALQETSGDIDKAVGRSYSCRRYRRDTCMRVWT